MKSLRPLLLQSLVALTAGMSSAGAQAGNQQYEPLAASVQAALHAAVADQAHRRATGSQPRCHA